MGVGLIGIAVLLGTIGCCCSKLVEGAAVPVKIAGEEMFRLCQGFFPHLKVGETLFVTTGEYHLFSISDYLAVCSSTSQLPPCRFKATLVVLGKIHENLNTLAGVGIAMGVPNVSPAWFVVMVTSDKVFYGFDPINGNSWRLRPQDVAMLII
jgi:hypothetical protein